MPKVFQTRLDNKSTKRTNKRPKKSFYELNKGKLSRSFDGKKMSINEILRMRPGTAFKNSRKKNVNGKKKRAQSTYIGIQ